MELSTVGALKLFSSKLASAVLGGEGHGNVAGQHEKSLIEKRLVQRAFTVLLDLNEVIFSLNCIMHAASVVREPNPCHR